MAKSLSEAKTHVFPARTTPKCSFPTCPEDQPRLSIEMVPQTAWFKNVRSAVRPRDWDNIRRKVYQRASFCCQICGGQGSRHPVEAHEIWDYDDENHVQKLDRVIALCPACHRVKHMGFSRSQGLEAEAELHLARVNGWTLKQARTYIDQSFTQWTKRSQVNWTMDMEHLEDEYGIKPKEEFTDV